MATLAQFGLAARIAMLDAGLNTANGGTLVGLTGTRPANADTAITSQTTIFTVSLPSPAFAGASGSLGAAVTKLFQTLTAVNATSSGTVTWFRVFKSDGTTVVVDGNVGTSGADLNFSNVTFNSGDNVSIAAGSEYSFNP